MTYALHSTYAISTRKHLICLLISFVKLDGKSPTYIKLILLNEVGLKEANFPCQSVIHYY